MRRFLEKYQTEDFTWSFFRSFGESKILRSSYFWLALVPIAAKMFGSINEIAQFNIFGHSVAVHLTLPFSWKIFYFSSLCFSMATFIFSYKCPKIVRNYSTFFEYKQSGRGMIYLESEIERLFFKEANRDLQHKLLNVPGLIGSKFSSVIKNNLTRFAMAVKSNSVDLGPGGLSTVMTHSNADIESDLFWAVRDFKNQIYPKARMIITALYGSGFLLLGIIVIQNLVFVLKNIL